MEQTTDRASSAVVTPDGRRLTLEAEGYDLSEPWFVAFRTRPKDGYTASDRATLQRAFQIGPTGTALSHATVLLEAEVRERFRMHGGEVLLAVGPDDAGIAAWTGPWHDLYAFVYGDQRESAAVAWYFDRLAVRDDPEGLRVRPTHPGEEIHAVTLSTSVPSAGHLEVTDARESAALLPRWSGARVRSGEVWRRKAADGPDPSEQVVVHASETAVTVLYQDHEAARDGRLQFLEALVALRWH
jgi:hypothetical protein